MFRMVSQLLHRRFFITTLVLITLTTGTLSHKNITLGGLISQGGAGADWDGTTILKAAELALLHVNSDPDVLPGYDLKIDVKNSKCRTGEGIKGLVELINEEPTKLMIFGASCSVVSQPVAEIGQHWNLVQISFSSTSDALSNRVRFPYFFRTVAAESALSYPWIALMKEYGWKKVAVIYHSIDVYTIAMNKFCEELTMNNINILAKESFLLGETPTVQLRNIMNKDARIIVSSAFLEGDQKMFCEAYRIGMYGSRYVWIKDTVDTYDWWKNVTLLGCTEQQMYEAVKNYIAAGILPLRNDAKHAISGLTANQYREAYASYTNGELHTDVDYAPYGYDAVWAVALALHEVAEQLTAENSSVMIEDFNYDNTNHLRERFYAALANLEFEGITGLVSFDKSGNRLLQSIVIKQLIDGVQEIVAGYLQEEGLQWIKEERLLFTGGGTPQDGPVQETVHLGIEMPTFIIFTVLAVVGMGVTIAFLIFNIRHRTRRLIKLSCPNVNNVIAVGCFMCYVDVIVAGLNENVASQSAVQCVCLAQVWILPIAFSLAFGGLFAKTWRVHVIFRNKTKRTRIVDYHLFAIIGVVVAIDIIIISVWTAYDPSQVVRVYLADQVDTVADKIIARYTDRCDSPESPKFVWIGIVFGWKGILLIYGAFLAWETRTVTMPQLNDSKYIAVAIYNVAIPSIIIAPLVTFIGGDMPGVSYILTASCIIFGTTVTNCLIFIPKIIALRQEGGDGAFQDQGNFSTQVAPSQATNSITVDGTAINKEGEIGELQNVLKQKDAEIQRLMELVKEKNGDQDPRP